MKYDDQYIEVQNTTSRVKTHREYSTASYCARQYIFAQYDMKRTLDIKDMYYIENTLSDKNYYIRGIIKDITNTLNKNEKEYYLALNLDYITSMYKIKQISKEEYENLVANKTTLKIANEKSDKFTVIDPDVGSICETLFSDYQEKLVNEPQLLYNLLTEECKSSKFKQYQTFYEYINENADNIYYSNLLGYTIQRNEEYTKYTLTDSNGNEINIYETEPMQYKVEI